MTKFKNDKHFNTIGAGNAAYPQLADTMGRKYELMRINIPVFMITGMDKSDEPNVSNPNSE